MVLKGFVNCFIYIIAMSVMSRITRTDMLSGTTAFFVRAVEVLNRCNLREQTPSGFQLFFAACIFFSLFQGLS